ncbi:MAG: hypothetical protein N3A66_01700, partial [Planctomycetota bacterium]|nr:hypothetical protein [Planctomycetota bacterium]
RIRYRYKENTVELEYDPQQIRAEDAQRAAEPLLRELGVRSVPINFLTPIAGTPLANRPPLPAEEALRIIALYRFLLPNATLRLCGGRPVVLADRQADALCSGANGLMTGNYLPTPGFDPAADRRLVESLGRRAKALTSAHLR